MFNIRFESRDGLRPDVSRILDGTAKAMEFGRIRIFNTHTDSSM